MEAAVAHALHPGPGLAKTLDVRLVRAGRACFCRAPPPRTACFSSKRPSAFHAVLDQLLAGRRPPCSGLTAPRCVGDMFSLLYGLWEYIFRKEELRILVLGLDKSGKTTLLERLKELYTDVPGLEPDAILPTVGLNVGRIEACNAHLILWDLGGQLGLRGIWEKYYADAHGLLYVVDAADPSR